MAGQVFVVWRLLLGFLPILLSLLFSPCMTWSWPCSPGRLWEDYWGRAAVGKCCQTTQGYVTWGQANTVSLWPKGVIQVQLCASECACVSFVKETQWIYWSPTSVQMEISLQLLKTSTYNFVQSFMVPWGWTRLTLLIPSSHLGYVNTSTSMGWIATHIHVSQKMYPDNLSLRTTVTLFVC